jgi:hypothetical protein
MQPPLGITNFSVWGRDCTRDSPRPRILYTRDKNSIRIDCMATGEIWYKAWTASKYRILSNFWDLQAVSFSLRPL